MKEKLLTLIWLMLLPFVVSKASAKMNGITDIPDSIPIQIEHYQDGMLYCETRMVPYVDNGIPEQNPQVNSQGPKRANTGKTTWTIGSGGNFVDINAAMADDRVVAGDVLELKPGTILTGTQMISKAIHLKGNGYEMDSNGNLANNIAQLQGYLQIRAEGARVSNLAIEKWPYEDGTSSYHLPSVYTYSSNSIIEGSYLNGWIYAYADNVTIRQCFFKGGIYGNNSYKNCMIHHNIISSSYTNLNGFNLLKNMTNATIDHNIFYSIFGSSSSTDYLLTSISSSTITNNIIVHFQYDKSYTGTYNGTITSDCLTNNTVNHNVFSGSSPNTNNRGEINAIGDIFDYTKYVSALSRVPNYDACFHLVANSPAAGYATDGGDCGPWSGAYPYVVGGTVGSGDDNPDTTFKDGDIFTAQTAEGVEMTFQVLSAQNKTCQVGANKSTCISKDYSGSVTIPETVKGLTVVTIGPYAFNQCKISAIKIPNTVTTIEWYVFMNCTNLESITIPTSVTSIGKDVFNNSFVPFFKVEEGNSVYDSRNNCNAIIETATNKLLYGGMSTMVPEDVAAIGQSAFFGRIGMQSINIPNSVTVIENSAFSNSSLTEITLPDNLTTLGGSAFFGCSNLSRLTIPANVTSIGQNVVTHSGIQSLVINSENKVYDSRNNCNAIIETATNTLISGCDATIIPASVKTIGEYAFYMAGFSSIIIPDGVNNIGPRAFLNCSNLKSVTISNSVTNIGYASFAGCSELPSITIPNSVTSIDSYVFNSCNSLMSVTSNIQNPFKTANSAFSGVPSNATLYVPAGTVAQYRALADWNRFTSIEESSSNHSFKDGDVFTAQTAEGVEMTFKVISASEKTCQVGKGGFSGQAIDRSYTGYITIPGYAQGYKVINIGEYAFWGYSNLTGVTIPSTVTTIDKYAFAQCHGFTEMVIPSSVTTINEAVCHDCINIKSITISPNIKELPRSAFSNCESLTSISLPEGLQVIGESAFNYCLQLNSISIPNSVHTIKQTAFKYCKSLTSIEIPANITAIGENVLGACIKLNSIKVNPNNNVYDSRNNCNAIMESATNTIVAGCKNTLIPNETTVIGDCAFWFCENLTQINIPPSVYKIGNNAFQGCKMLPNITIPTSVKSIGQFAFGDCTSFVSITIPKSVSSIGDRLFIACTNLTSVTFPSSVTYFGDYMFSACDNLTDIYYYGKTVPVTENNTFGGFSPANATLHVPAVSVSTFKSTKPWSDFRNIVAIGEDVEDEDYDWSIGSGGDFADVNSAMSDSRVKDGHVLQVLNGTILNGTTYITKAVTIKGNGYEDKSDGHIYGIYIDCEGVTIKNLHNGYIYVRANNATIERCRTSHISGRENYESDDVTIRGCLVLGYVCSYYNNISYGWKISNNIIIATNYWGNALDYLEEATIDHNLIINYEGEVYGLYAVGAVNNSSFTNNIFLRPTYSQGISDNAINSATKFEYNIISNSGSYSKWPTNITGYNNMAKLFECSGERTTDTYYKLVAGSPALGYANDGGDCGPWSGAFPYLINGKESTTPEPDPTQWKLDPTLTTDTERYEFATLDALFNFMLSPGSWYKEGMTDMTVSVADATYTMDLIPNINTSNFGSVEEMIEYIYTKIEQLRERILVAEDYYGAYNITFSMEAQHEAIFQFNLQNSQAYNAFLEFMAVKIVEMQAQGMTQAEIDARKAEWFAQIKEYMNRLYEAMQKFASHFKTTNIIIFLDNTRINPDPDSIEPNDLLALKNIYNMLGGSSWTNKRWKINDYGAKKEDFPGVTFDDEGYVVEINLENNNLRGTINPTGWTWQLCLPRLTGLYLQKNNISGDLSPWLKGVNRGDRLKALNMSYNNLTEISDSIPSSITSLNLENQNREWYRPDGVYTDPLKIEAMSDMTPIRLYLSANQTVVMPSLFTYNHKSQTHSARPTIYIINAEGIDKYGYFNSSGEDTYSLAWKDNEYTEKQNAPCYVRFDNPYGSVYPAYLRYIEGDANMSGYTDVLDVQTTLNYVLNGGGVWQFNRSAANTYEDNLINVQDIVCMVNIVLNNEAVAEGIILNTSSSRRHLRRAADAMDAQGWLYTEKGRVMLTTVNEVGAIDLELKGVSTSQVSLLLNHSQYQMIGRNTEEGSRYVIFSPTGQPIPASEEVALLAVSSQTELIGAQAADMEAQELELAIGQPTGLEAIDNGQLTNDNAPIYNVAGQRLSKMQRGINITNGRKVLK